jgi:prepilin-type N-terminal cleavage/methylation domain-containing protein
VKRTAAAGFTLIELVVVLAVIGILAASVTPAVVQRIVDARIAATAAEARALHEAIVGDHTQSRFGFVGDMGRLPGSFQELVQRGSLPAHTTNTRRSVGMGWRGPYINIGASPNDYLLDAFGRPYTGASTGQVRSAGADGVMNNADDIVYPPAPPVITGNVTVTVKTLDGSRTVVDPAGCRVELFHASNGSENTASDSSAPFTFTNVPMGLHAIRVTSCSVSGDGNGNGSGNWPWPWPFPWPPPWDDDDGSSGNGGGTTSGGEGQDTIVVHPASTTAVELWF